MTLKEHIACSLSQNVMSFTNTCNHARSHTSTVFFQGEVQVTQRHEKGKDSRQNLWEGIRGE